MKRTSLYDSLGFIPFSDPDREKTWKNTAKEVLKVLISSSLSTRQKQVIMLYYYKGMKQRDIAKLLGISEYAVSHAKISGLTRLRFYLSLIRR